MKTGSTSETMKEDQIEPKPGAPLAASSGGVTREEVRHVASLASLELTPQEEERMERDLNAILGYVAELNELDTAAVEPLSQVSELFAAAAGSVASEQALRVDEPRPSLPRTVVMSGAPATDGIFFKVPKVIER